MAPPTRLALLLSVAQVRAWWLLLLKSAAALLDMLLLLLHSTAASLDTAFADPRRLLFPTDGASATASPFDNVAAISPPAGRSASGGAAVR